MTSRENNTGAEEPQLDEKRLHRALQIIARSSTAYLRSESCTSGRDRKALKALRGIVELSEKLELLQKKEIEIHERIRLRDRIRHLLAQSAPRATAG